MSVRATSFVFERSPYSGNAFAVHLALGDLANEANDWEIWERVEILAPKSRCSVPTVRRVLAQMVADGYLELVEAGGGRGRRARYRFLMPSKPTRSAKVSGSDSYASEGGNLPSSGAETYSPDDPRYLSTEIGTEGNGSGSAAVDVRDEILDLCRELAEAIAAYSESPLLRYDTKRWTTDMRLLVERGPAGLAEPEPLGVERVRNSIRFIFGVLNVPEGSGRFCWASVVRSPGNLRAKWPQIYEAAVRLRRTAGRDPLAEFRDGPSRDLARAVGADPLAEFRRSSSLPVLR